MPRKCDQRTVQTGSIGVQKFGLARSHLCRLGGCEYSGACLDQVRDLKSRLPWRRKSRIYNGRFSPLPLLRSLSTGLTDWTTDSFFPPNRQRTTTLFWRQERRRWGRNLWTRRRFSPRFGEKREAPSERQAHSHPLQGGASPRGRGLG